MFTANPRNKKHEFFAGQWTRIILDEGHSIVNKNTKMFQSLVPLNGQARWILSGKCNDVITLSV